MDVKSLILTSFLLLTLGCYSEAKSFARIKGYSFDTSVVDSNRRLRHNSIAFGILGNNYLPPFDNGFHNRDYLITKFSINYSRLFIGPKSCWAFSIGFSLFTDEWWSTNGNEFTHPISVHNSTGIVLPAGFLWRPRYKDSGFWFGIYYAPAIGKQQFFYLAENGRIVVHTFNYDSQIMPNISYSVRTKKTGFVFTACFSPKFVSSFAHGADKYKWRILPYGGITIGSSW